MKLIKKLAGGAVLLITTTLLAQPTTSPAQDPAAIVSPKAEDMIRKVPVLLAEAGENQRRVTILQLAARKAKDVIKLNCISEKLLQIKALRNILDGLRSDFDAANDVTRELAFSQITEKSANIGKLREDAQICAGELELSGDFKSDYTGPDIPDDPGKDLFPDGVEPPGYASPYN